MTDRPILMSAPMVRALLREIEAPGTGKTQTRRLAERFVPAKHPPAGMEGKVGNYVPTIWQSVKPGERLWVRETWVHGLAELGQKPVYYRADNDDDNTTWRPSIHMPRKFSRITLLVTATKMEGLLDISEDDAKAEGFAPGRLDDGFGPRDIGGGCTIESPGTSASVGGMFQIAWKSLHPDWDGWSSPEVVAITFRPVLSNIDQCKEAG